MCPTSSNNLLIHQHRSESGHRVAFTTTAAGNMSLTVLDTQQTAEDTARNRRQLEESLGIEPGSTRFVSQTHSAIVRFAGTQGWGNVETLGEGDAIISRDGTAPIAILVADCLPVAFTTDFGPTAIAHAGRVGLLDGILQNTVDQLKDLDIEGTGTIRATIGPGICGKCYEVPEQMRTESARKLQAIHSETSWGTAALDLPAAAASILDNAGVRVDLLGECTLTNHQLFSHRRQPGAGRIAGIVWPT